MAISYKTMDALLVHGLVFRRCNYAYSPITVPALHKAIVTARDEEEATWSDIADATGLSLSTVRKYSNPAVIEGE